MATGAKRRVGAKGSEKTLPRRRVRDDEGDNGVRRGVVRPDMNHGFAGPNCDAGVAGDR